MRIPTLCLGLLVSISAVAESSIYEGLWFTCIPKMAGRNPFCLTEIKREGNGLSVVHECGSNYSTGGLGLVSADKLVVYGCQEFRGEKLAPSCSDTNPAVVFTLTKAAAKKIHVSREFALKKSEPIHTTKDRWESLAERCGFIVDGTEPE